MERKPAKMYSLASSKKCARCRRSKPRRLFNVDRSRKDGRDQYCRHCCKKHYEVLNTFAFRKQANAAARVWRKENKKAAHVLDRRGHLRKVYGITEGAYKERSRTQKHRCKICGKKNINKRRLVVDHKGRKVRGLLCDPCNLMLGIAKDSPRRLMKAASYLRKAGHHG